MSTNLSPAEANSILRAHNDFRAAHGIIPMVWNDTVASFAAIWAKQSASYPNCARPDDQGGAHGGPGEYGQNLAWGWGFDEPNLVDMTEFAIGWMEEIIPTLPVGSGPDGSYNHASQVLWGDSLQLGCAKGVGKECVMLVCEYDIFGNIDGAQWNTGGGLLEPQITGIGMDNQLYRKKGLNGKWNKLTESKARLIDLIQVPGTGFVGVAPDNTLWSASSLTGSWSLAPNSGSVISIAVMADKTTYVGVGMDNQLYSRNGLAGSWNYVPNSGYVLDITVLFDGTLLGVGMDYKLYTKKDLKANWVLVPQSGSVTRAKQQPDGSILGVGMDKALWRKQHMEAPWVAVPDSCCVLSAIITF
ncbi:hypothetical protein HDU99_009299 [Rhizoclosmatium hyalinum]|nr:hypothetical protein HDU99_009299 [Rhizoclosmatium hyalinum]